MPQNSFDINAASIKPANGVTTNFLIAGFLYWFEYGILIKRSFDFAPAPTLALKDGGTVAPDHVEVTVTASGNGVSIVEIFQFNGTDFVKVFEQTWENMTGAIDFDITGLTAGTSYQIKARCKNDAGYSEFSEALEITAALPLPSVPNLSASGVIANLNTQSPHIDLRGNSTYAASYVVESNNGGELFSAEYWNNNGDGTFDYIGSGWPASVNIVSRAKAVNASGESDWSETVSFWWND